MQQSVKYEYIAKPNQDRFRFRNTINFQFFEADIRNLEPCQNTCHKVDYVLHQAALGSIPRSIKDPIKTNTVNIDGFLNMLAAARD